MVSIRRVFPLSPIPQNLEFPLVVSNTARQAYRGEADMKMGVWEASLLGI